MVKPENWGTWAVIERTPKKKQQKSISCELCSSFCLKESVCKKIPNAIRHYRGNVVSCFILRLNMTLLNIGMS